MTLQLAHALTKAFKQYIIGFENHYCVCIFSITKKNTFVCEQKSS